MGDTNATLAPPVKAPEHHRDRQPSQRNVNPLLGLQQSLGNQAMLRLLESGVIQAKMRVSQPGDPDEIEADRVAEKVVSAQTAPVIQRKCACSGGAVALAALPPTAHSSPRGRAGPPRGHGAGG